MSWAVVVVSRSLKGEVIMGNNTIKWRSDDQAMDLWMDGYIAMVGSLIVDPIQTKEIAKKKIFILDKIKGIEYE